MPWSEPADPVSGTSITRAWAIANVTGLFRWLRGLTGNADPPGAGYVARSTSTTLTAWYDLDGVIAQQVHQVQPIYSAFGSALDKGAGFFDIGSTADSPLGAGSGWYLIQNRHWNWGTDNRFQMAIHFTDPNELYVRLVTSGAGTTWRKLWHAGNDGAGSGLDADTLDGVQGSGYALIANQVPSGLIAGFRTAALAPGWTRFTDGDGRFLIGAGTTDGQTFTQDSQNVAAWSHLHSGTSLGTDTSTAGSVASGGGSTATGAHSHAITGNTANALWLPPVRVVVYAIKT